MRSIKGGHIECGEVSFQNRHAFFGGLNASLKELALGLLHSTS